MIVVIQENYAEFEKIIPSCDCPWYDGTTKGCHGCDAENCQVFQMLKQLETKPDATAEFEQIVE